MKKASIWVLTVVSQCNLVKFNRIFEINLRKKNRKTPLSGPLCLLSSSPSSSPPPPLSSSAVEGWGRTGGHHLTLWSSRLEPLPFVQLLHFFMFPSCFTPLIFQSHSLSIYLPIVYLSLYSLTLLSIRYKDYRMSSFRLFPVSGHPSASPHLPVCPGVSAWAAPPPGGRGPRDPPGTRQHPLTMGCNTSSLRS